MIEINKTVLMSGAQYFTNDHAINAHMDASVTADNAAAQAEHDAIRKSLDSAGVEVIQVPPPENCQDGVYTANWGLCRDDTVVLSNLPNKRQPEQPYAEKILTNLGKKLIKVPDGLAFSGQGDALPCGNLLFTGSIYRTDPKVHQFLADTLGFKVISVQTVPKLDNQGKQVINEITGWPDSYFYDIDLALGVITPELIIWCPEAFTDESQDKIKSLPIQKLEVLYEEALNGFACNLVSTGETIIMSNKAPILQAALEAHGFKTITPAVTELGKGGGYIRCTTLTL